jgi:hypothetical protein
MIVNDVSFGGMYSAAFKVKVLGEDERPVTNASVLAAFWDANAPGYGGGRHIGESITKLSDTNGVCEFEGRCDGSVEWKVTTEGYYPFYGPMISFTNVTALGKLEPWGSVYYASVRRIVNPIPMYSRNLNLRRPLLQVPEIDKEYGFDLMKADWVEPFGKGTVPDLLIRVEVKPVKVDDDFFVKNPEASKPRHKVLFIGFPNPDDGIQPFYASPHVGSTFRLPRYAFETGYENKCVIEYISDGLRVIQNDMSREDQNYLFRVRTRRDEKGKMVSALYGKIEGRFDFDQFGVVTFHYFPPAISQCNSIG